MPQSNSVSAAGQQQGPYQDSSPNVPGKTEFVAHFEARDHSLVQDQQGMRISEVESDLPQDGRVVGTRWGLPDMSARELEFLLPYDASFRSIKVQVLEETTEILGTFPMAPAGLPVESPVRMSSNLSWSDPVVQLDPEGRDMSVYGSQEDYPLEAVDVASVGRDRAARILKLAFHPFRWNPASMELTKVTSLAVLVSWERRRVSPHQRELDLGDPALPVALQANESLVVLEDFDASYSSVLRETDFDYLIVSTDHILSSVATLPPFISMKEAQGYKVATRSIEWIESTFPAATTQLSLRRYLKSIYREVGLRYLLVISGHMPVDPGWPGWTSSDRIPMFLTWPRGGHQLSAQFDDEEEAEHSRYRVPTDLYYADLSGPDNWDVDGDGFAGERRDDVRTYSSKPKKRYVTDFYQELGVARIPFDTVPYIEQYLQDLIEYQTATLDQATLSARARVLLAMAEYTAWQAGHVGSEETGDAIFFSIPTPWNVFDLGPLNPWRMYQVGIYDEELSSTTLFDRWIQEEVGLVVWSGHGDRNESQMTSEPTKKSGYKDANSHLWSSFVDTVDQPSLLKPAARRAFVTSDSCQNGSPYAHPFGSSSTFTLLENLLMHSSIGAILNTGNGIGYDLRDDNVGDKTWANDLVVSNVRRLCRGWSLSWSVKKTRQRGDYSGRGINCGIKAQNLLSINAFGDPASFYVYE